MRNDGIGSWARRRERLSPDDVAVIDGEVARTYRELSQRSQHVAAWLRSCGVARGDRVAHLGRNSVDFLEVLLGATQLGAVFVPLNWRLTPHELRWIVADAGPRVMVHDGGLADVVAEVVADPEVVVPTTVACGAELTRLVAAHEPTWVDVDVDLDDTAFLIYTSGTTGRPKGAMLSHRNVTFNAVNVMIDTGLSADEVALVCAPMFHVAALDMVAMPSLMTGGTIVLTDAFEPGRVLDLIVAHRVTVMFGVPAMFNALSQHEAFDDTDLSSMRRALCGGAPVPLPTIRTWLDRDVTFLQGYGMTETAPGALFLGPRRAVDKAGTAGVASFFTDVEVRGPDGTPVAAGERGEVVVAGPNVMQGYWHRPDATAEAIRDGWFHSGDIATVDDEGYVTIVDRLKDMYVSGGENVSPAEVEDAIFAHPGVAECAVIGIPDERWGEVGRALVVARPGSDLDADDLLAHLGSRLARYKLPASVVFVDDLPRTGAGKLRKNHLRRAYGDPLRPVPADRDQGVDDPASTPAPGPGDPSGVATDTEPR